MKVKVKRIDTKLSLPEYKTPGAVAFDFIVRKKVTIKSHEVGKIPSNMVIEVPKRYMLYVKDRSSTAMRKGLIIISGVIDQDFCGNKDEISLQFYNYTNKDVTIEKGERIAQGIFIAIMKATWDEQSKMSAKNRGGFGSTG